MTDTTSTVEKGSTVLAHERTTMRLRASLLSCMKTHVTASVNAHLRWTRFEVSNYHSADNGKMRIGLS